VTNHAIDTGRAAKDSNSSNSSNSSSSLAARGRNDVKGPKLSRDQELRRTHPQGATGEGFEEFEEFEGFVEFEHKQRSGRKWGTGGGRGMPIPARDKVRGRRD
jgi:hypothetical protein